jgi:hypothetical protein
MPAYTGLERYDACTEWTAVTSNPAAGVVSVDLKTFTGRGRVSYVYASCVADANVANRILIVQKISGANVVYIGLGATFTATTTGTIFHARGYQSAQGTAYASLAECDFAPGDILRVIVNNGQAGDDLAGLMYCFKEML